VTFIRGFFLVLNKPVSFHTKKQIIKFFFQTNTFKYFNCIWPSFSNKNHIALKKNTWHDLAFFLNTKNSRKNNFVRIFAYIFRFNSKFIKSMRIGLHFKNTKYLFCFI
jgi:hypothetical protein